MLQRINQKAFLFFVLAAGALLILASGISNILLEPGIPGATSAAASRPLAELFELRLGGNEVIFYVFLLCLVLAVIGLAAVPEGRVRLIRFALLVLVLYLLSRLLAPGAPVQSEQAAKTETARPAPEEEFLPPPSGQSDLVSNFETPDWLVTAAGIGLALLLVGGGAAVIWYLFWSRGVSPLEELSQEAEAAVDALAGGGDYHDIVLNCYARMSQVLFERRGVSRESAMTPHEFERALVKLGFPAEPIRTLTRLFEEVRYGSIAPGEHARQTAVWSLNAIISYCRSPQPV